MPEVLFALSLVMLWLSKVNTYDDSWYKLTMGVMAVSILLIVIKYGRKFFSDEHRRNRRLEREADAAEELKQASERTAAKAKRDHDQAWEQPPTIPSREEFAELVLKDYRAKTTTPIRDDYLAQLVRVQSDIFASGNYGPQLFSPAHVAEKITLIMNCCIDGLLAFEKQLPPQLLEKTYATSPFNIPVKHLDLVGTHKADREGRTEWEFAPKQTAAFTALGSPFHTNQKQLEGIFDFRKFTYDWGDMFRFDYGDKEWKEHTAFIVSLTQEYDKVFNHTPYWGRGLSVLPATEHTEPFHIPPHLRFAHEFLVGASRSGKTTYLTARLLDDFDRVARGECSVIVMDSQNELITNLAKLKLFYPGGPLYSKLIYLQPAQYPLATNIFDVGALPTTNKERTEIFRAMYDNVEFFINSIFKADTSPQQTTMLKFAIQALVAIPGATMADLQRLMEDEGVKHYAEHFDTLTPNVKKWIFERLHHPDFKVTRTAVRNRLDGMLADPFFSAMFSTSHNKLDLYEELNSPKIILVDTAGLGGVLEPFGRYFIAKLDEAMVKRKFMPKASKLPVYFYIDEAGDYIRDEPIVAKILDKLGKQNLGMVIAIQRKEHITDPNVLDALEHVAIQSWTLKRPFVNIAIERAEPIAIEVPLIKLEDLPRQSDDDVWVLQEIMKRRYGTTETVQAGPPPSEKPAEPKPSSKPTEEQPTSSNETDAKPW